MVGPSRLTEEDALPGMGRDRNPLLLSLTYQRRVYRGARSGLKRSKGDVPSLGLISDVEAAAEEVAVTIPLLPV
jgi:hypothetical protein